MSKSEEDRTSPRVIPEPVHKGGYQPVNEGYQPGDKRGFSPTNSNAVPVKVPPLPVTDGTATVKPAGEKKV
jgi:hypothetical protein